MVQPRADHPSTTRRRADRLTRYRRAVQALTDVARAVSQSLDPAEVLPAAVTAVAAAVQVDGALIRTYDAATGRLTLASSHGVSRDFADTLRVLDFGQGLAGHVILTNQPLVVEDARDDPRLPWIAAKNEEMRSVVVVPINARSGPLGTMAVFMRQPRRFRVDELELLQAIANQVGIALENARLYEAERGRVSALEELNQLKSDFASTVSHELRTPMTVVKTAFDQLARDWDRLGDERRREYVRVGKGGADRLKRLLENLLLVSRIEDDRVQLRLVEVDAASAAEEVVADVRSRHDRAVAASVPDAVPPVRADRDQLCEVLLNLVENAIRYSNPPSPIEVRARSEDGHVVFEVRDRGIGIAPHDMGRLFRRFERIDRTVRSQTGTGLGLYICRRLVEAMGGEIWADSQLGVGSTFSVRLPAAVGASEDW